MKKVYGWEPWFFIFFGIFHLHRIWGLIDRKTYADFWIGILENKGVVYIAIMGLLAALCILGMITFINNRQRNYWWRWIYLCGGSYLLFDLFAIALGLEFWQDLLFWMFDVTSPYWNLLWGGFILMGGVVFVLGCKLLRIVGEGKT